MIELHFYDPRIQEDYHTRDTTRISQVLNSRGYDASYDDIKRAWEAHSEDYCAGWLIPGDDEDIFYNIMKYLKT